MSGWDVLGLPCERVNELLKLELTGGAVHISEKVLQHIKERHPLDGVDDMQVIESVIIAPDYIGQAPHHQENFELIKCVEDRYVLVAVSGRLNDYGKYPVQSAYTVPRDTIHRRIRKGYLNICKDGKEA